MATHDLNLGLDDGLTLLRVSEEAQAAACYSLMRELRPQLADEAAWLAYWKRAGEAGYRLWSLHQDGVIVALASYRLQENMVYGNYLYVEDLVTDSRLRSSGYGQLLMDKLKREAQVMACSRMVLDTPLSNSLGHRFYFRQGLLATSIRFNQAISL